MTPDIAAILTANAAGLNPLSSALMSSAAAAEFIAIYSSIDSPLKLVALEMSALGMSARANDAPPPPSTAQVIRLHGAITPRGESGSEGFVKKMRAAGNNPDVGAVVLDVNSPGGTVAGTAEAANAVADVAKLKPVYALADSMMASAAYWIGSQASQLWVTPSGSVGSIGVKAIHFDVSKALEDMGVKPTVITSGAYKGELSPFSPLSEEAQAYVQGEADTEHQSFIQAVAKGRNTSAAKVASDFGQGRMISAPRAVALGMADRVGTMSELLSSIRTPGGAFRQRRANIF